MVKEAAYHAAKYDSTVAAINALNQSEQLTKTAGILSDGINAAANFKPWEMLGNAAQSIPSKADFIEAMYRGDAGSTLGELAKGISPEGLAAGAGLAGLGAGAGAGIGALMNKLKGGQAAQGGVMNSISSGLSSVGQAIKDHPYIAGGLGLAGAGAAALPFLMGGDGAEKQSSYDPSKLAALRNVLANMQ